MKRRQFNNLIIYSLIGTGINTISFAESINSKDKKISKKDDHLKDYLFKMKNFDDHHPDDYVLSKQDFILLKSSLRRLKQIQRTVGYGNFNLLNFDDALKIAHRYSKVGDFSKAEKIFLEKIFYQNSLKYGFKGEKVLHNLTKNIDKKKTKKIPYTGHYLYSGTAIEQYNKILKDAGNQVILTSGIRSIIKQFYLFLNKAYKADGNLSLASRSLAPPGYSYHGIGDFDLGQKNFGIDNFTERFTTTPVYKKLNELGYIKLRYYKDNKFGVRFEPWHISLELNS